MPHWHVRTEGQTIRLSHIQPDDTGGVWSGEVVLWRGAPSWDSHRELLAAAQRITNPAVNRDMVRHAWTWDLPEWWEGAWNCGADRKYMTLSATGGSMNWTIVLRFPLHTPPFVFAAVAAGFGAELVTPETTKGSRERVEAQTAAIPAASAPVAPRERNSGRLELPRRGRSRARNIATANRQEATT